MLRLSLPLLLLVVATVAADRARACGPDFPPTLLEQRAATLRDLPDGPFDEAARHLVDDLPKDPAFVARDTDPDDARDHGTAAERALYDEGAAAFNANDVDKAERLFRQLLALPEAERKNRSTWAAFMLGRLGDERMWSETRRLAAAGFDDDLGLAVASFGQEARVVRSRGDVAEAITLYAREARAGGGGAGFSLLTVVREAVGPEEVIEDDESDEAARAPVVVDAAALMRRVKPLMASPIGRRLLTIYASMRPNERTRSMAVIVDQLARQPQPEQPDHLAAALYRRDRLDDAARVIADVNTPLALWVKAKLALRAGRNDDATALLAQATKAFPPAKTLESDSWWHPLAATPQARLLGEEAVLSLARREYTAALTQLLEAGSWWQDVAWVAERVLTTDELVAYVEQHAGAAPVHAVDVNGDDGSSWGAPTNQKAALRYLLARRLVRDGRFDDALRFFDAPALRAKLANYQASLAHARATGSFVDDIDRAEALFAAARISREDGFELRGSELGPDWFVWGGYHDSGVGWDDDGNEVRVDPLAANKESGSVDANEVVRASSSLAHPDRRYHYRVIAADLALDAATHVPPRSQAYAALLCQVGCATIPPPSNASGASTSRAAPASTSPRRSGLPTTRARRRTSPRCAASATRPPSPTTSTRSSPSFPSWSASRS